MKFINETGKILILQYATGPCDSKTCVLYNPEGNCEIISEEIVGAMYIHDATKEELEKLKKMWIKDKHKFKECK